MPENIIRLEETFICVYYTRDSMQEIFVKVQWDGKETILDLHKASMFMHILEKKGIKNTFSYIQ